MVSSWNRCLPWAASTPCIVCQENCPVTPKAIYVVEKFETVRSGARNVLSVQGNEVRISGEAMEEGQYATGDYYISTWKSEKQSLYRISANNNNSLTIGSDDVLDIDGVENLEIQVRLQQPVVDQKKCIGCGICQHECPVQGTRAIRVTSDNESRSAKRVI